MKGEAISKIISKVNKHVLELQKNVDSIENIQNIADGIRTTCQNKLGELINFSNALRRAMNDKIAEIFEDMKKAEI